jgi:hypothetical protein
MKIRVTQENVIKKAPAAAAEAPVLNQVAARKAPVLNPAAATDHLAAATDQSLRKHPAAANSQIVMNQTSAAAADR